MIRMSLIGAGFIGSVHATNLAAHLGVEFVGVADIDTARAVALADRHETRALDVAEALDPAVVDAVLIASSTDTHAQHLRAGAAAGLACLCEKPIDLDLQLATEVVSEVASGVGANARPMMVDFNRRFDRDYAELARLAGDGALGTVELVQMTTRGPVLPPLDYIAVSGGQMRDQTVHFFDLARWITGEDPESVYATGTVFTDPRMADLGDVDTSAVTLRMPSGPLVQIDSVRRTAYGYDERIEVLGSDGMAESDRQRTGAVKRYGRGQVTLDGLHPGWFERVAPTYRSALDHFVSAVASGTQIGPSLHEALKAQAIAEAAATSLRTGQAEQITYPALNSVG